MHFAIHYIWKEKGTLFLYFRIQQTIVSLFCSWCRLFKPLIQVQISSNITLHFGELTQHLFNSAQSKNACIVCFTFSEFAFGYLSWDWVCPGLLCLGKSLLKQIPGQITGLRFLICDHSGDVTRSVSGSVVWGEQRREEATVDFLQLCSVCFVTSSRAQTSGLSTSNHF